MDKISISVFFPCYNEEQNVGTMLSKLIGYLPTISDDYEIIVVDDGSKDATVKIAEEFSHEDSHIKVISHETNRGYGASLRTGFETSNKEYIFFTDGDNQFDIAELTKMIPYVREFDIVAGYRIKRRDNLVRSINAKSFKLLIRILFGLKITDLNCAFKIFKKDVVKNIELKSSGALINAEMLIRAMKKGYTMKEVGVNHFPRQWGTQTGANPKVIFRAFSELFKLRKELY